MEMAISLVLIDVPGTGLGVTYPDAALVDAQEAGFVNSFPAGLGGLPDDEGQPYKEQGGDEEKENESAIRRLV